MKSNHTGYILKDVHFFNKGIFSLLFKLIERKNNNNYKQTSYKNGLKNCLHGETCRQDFLNKITCDYLKFL